MSNNTTPSNFLVRTAQAELARLQQELALQRGCLRDARRSCWGHDRDWQVKQVLAQRDYKLRIRKAELALSAFIAEHASFLAETPPHGRLCFHCFTGGLPIATHYCQRPEGHLGAHQDAHGAWLGAPKHPAPKVIESKPLKMTQESRRNMERFGTDWGNRLGPSIIIYRDITWYQHPLRRSYSCLGCQHLRFSDFGSTRCAHAEMLSKYEVPQAIATCDAKRLVSGGSCPATRKDPDAELTQPHPCPITGRDPDSRATAERVFRPFFAKARES